MDAILKRLPARLLAALATMAAVVTAGVVVFAVIDNRQVDIWPPKIHPKAEELGALPEFYGAMLDAIDVPMIVYEQEASLIKVIAANQAAADFYVTTREELIGQAPARLHEMIKPRIENFGDWAAEQMERISRASRRCTSIGTTNVPMRLVPGHPVFEGSWLLTSGCFDADGRSWVVTRFHPVTETSQRLTTQTE